MDLNLELTYEKKGFLGLCAVNESKYFPVNSYENPDDKKTVKKEAFQTVKQVLKLFNKNDLFNVWVCLYTAHDYKNASALIGIRQSWIDRDNGVYEVYIYGHNSTDVKKVSKDVLLKEVFRCID